MSKNFMLQYGMERQIYCGVAFEVRHVANLNVIHCFQWSKTGELVGWYWGDEELKLNQKLCEAYVLLKEKEEETKER